MEREMTTDSQTTMNILLVGCCYIPILIGIPMVLVGLLRLVTNHRYGHVRWIEETANQPG